MIRPGEIISYIQMCQHEGLSLQRGMNFRANKGTSVILMSLRRGAPYADRIEEGGRVLIYEGHDAQRTRSVPNPKAVDQPMLTPSGKLTQNGLFYRAAMEYKAGRNPAERIRVYEKIRDGIWVFNGVFELLDARQERSSDRNVFKFGLQITDSVEPISGRHADIDHSRLIPARVKLEVWKRDKGRCIICKAADNLHFDHIIPYAKGGSSLVAENIQLLCARHNLEKRDKIG